MSHALIKATAKDYIKQVIRVILDYRQERITFRFKDIERQLCRILFKPRRISVSPGYSGGNIINLFNQLKLI